MSREPETFAECLDRCAALELALTKLRDDLSIIIADHKLGKDENVKRAMKRIKDVLAAPQGMRKT